MITTKHGYYLALLERRNTTPKSVWLAVRQSIITMQAIDYKALDSFEALPTIRGLLVSGAHGFVLKHLPEISNIQANTLVGSLYVMHVVL